VEQVTNKPEFSKDCRKFESRFEDYLGGAPDSSLETHLTCCEQCHAALEDSRLAGELLREAREPASEPSLTFAANAMARIHKQETRAKSLAAFWAPLEFLATRLSLTAAVVLLALSVYLVEFAPHRSIAMGSIRTELSASDIPQPPADPVSNEEVLQSLAEGNNGH
jgi:hypothetical protein